MLRPTENLTDIWPLVTGGNMYNMMVHLDCQAQYQFSVLHILYIVGSLQLHYSKDNSPKPKDRGAHTQSSASNTYVYINICVWTLFYRKQCSVYQLEGLPDNYSWITPSTYQYTTIVVVVSEFLLFNFILSDGVCYDHMHAIWCVSHAICFMYLLCAI